MGIIPHMRIKMTVLMSALTLSLSIYSFAIEESFYVSEEVYTSAQIQEINQNLNSLSSDEIKEKAINLIDEKRLIEEKIDKGEVDPDDSSSQYIVRLKNIYSELNLIQKILSGAGLFLLIDEIFGSDDGPRIPLIRASDVNVSESDNTASVRVQLSNPFNQEITLNYNTSNGSAEEGADYQSATGSITFAPSETSKSFNIGIIDDDVFEIQESFIVAALSTHPGEEKVLLNSLKDITKRIKNIIFIIQPRHPKRANEIIKLIKNYHFKFKQRSVSQYPSKDTQVYLADTFGESGALICSANLIILGGTHKIFIFIWYIF